jgi:hypothetical protein
MYGEGERQVIFGGRENGWNNDLIGMVERAGIPLLISAI